MRPGTLKTGSNSLLMMRTLFILVVTIATFSITIFVVFYTLPSITLFLFEVIPSFWTLFCQSFIPRNLFILLNLIILCIFIAAHLHSPPPASSTSSACHLPTQVPSSSNALQLYSAQGQKLLSHTSDVVDLSTTEGIKLLKMETMYFAVHHGSGVQEDYEHVELTDYSSYGEDAEHYDNKDDDDDAEHYDNEDDDDDDELLVQSPTIINPVIQEIKEGQQAMKKGDDGQNTLLRIRGSNGGSSSLVPYILAVQSREDHGQQHSRPLQSERFTHKKLNKLASNIKRERSLSPSRISRPIGKTRAGDTLEATWKAICESKRHSSPLGYMSRSQHMLRKKSSGTRDIKTLAHDEGPTNMYKVSTINIQSPSLLSPLRQRPSLKEPSMPQDELNAKAEAFISNFFERNRIQREKSMMDYMEMVRRGAR